MSVGKQHGEVVARQFSVQSVHYGGVKQVLHVGYNHAARLPSS